MDNFEIADSFSLLAKLMDIHGENSFKSKSYSSAAFTIEKLPIQLQEIEREKISTLKGIGNSTALKIIELLDTGQLKVLNEIVLNTPPGILEMLNIKGIGPKKINIIWKEMELESVGELLYACQENRLKLFKGFGDKTQQNVADHIAFYLQNKGSFLYAQVIPLVPVIISFLQQKLGDTKIEITGQVKRQLEIITAIEFVVLSTISEIEAALVSAESFEIQNREADNIIYKTSYGIKVKLYASTPSAFVSTLITTSSSEDFIKALVYEFHPEFTREHPTEHSFFESIGLAFIPASLREDASVLKMAKTLALPKLIQKEDIKGIIHSHSTWSDGTNSIEEMANAAIADGKEYLVISDHSKSAFYANGLSIDKIKEQHYLIDELNEKLHPFKIFKSIESDILNDGSLDYPDAVLATFDLVIASVHSNLKMTKDKAMMRLLKAIQNPYTTILGHMTGRLLLSRPGYPVDHSLIIEACAAHNVVIELNAHPNRLDIDWRFIPEVLKANVMISIDPDAHSIEGMKDVNYGVLAAQKAMVSKENNLSSLHLKEFENFLMTHKKYKF